MRVVIAEDNVSLRDGLVGLLTDRGHEVVAAVGDGDKLRSAVSAYRPDVCVVDIRMPPTFTDEGLRAAIALRHEQPDVGVLVFSQYVETRYASELLAGSARGVGYLLKDRVADVREFVDALGGRAVQRRHRGCAGDLRPRGRAILTGSSAQRPRAALRWRRRSFAARCVSIERWWRVASAVPGG
jgi:DNA-binding NarL/FixJ family response regulator